jgi:hypothetical protein
LKALARQILNLFFEVAAWPYLINCVRSANRIFTLLSAFVKL